MKSSACDRADNHRGKCNRNRANKLVKAAAAVLELVEGEGELVEGELVKPTIGAKVVVAAALTQMQLSSVDKVIESLDSVMRLQSVKELSVDVFPAPSGAPSGATGVRVLLNRDSLEIPFVITIEHGANLTREELSSAEPWYVKERIARIVQIEANKSDEWKSMDSTMEIEQLLQDGGVRLKTFDPPFYLGPSISLEYKHGDRGLLWDLWKEPIDPHGAGGEQANGGGEQLAETEDEEGDNDKEAEELEADELEAEEVDHLDSEDEEEAFSMPVVGDEVQVADADETSGWVTVKVVKVRTATFDVKQGQNAAQKIKLRSKGWRPRKTASMDWLETAKKVVAAKKGVTMAVATQKIHDLDSETIKKRALAFTKKRAELDTEVDPYLDVDADSRYVANTKAARENAELMHPLSKEAAKIKKAIANVEAKTAELAEAEADLQNLVSDDKDKLVSDDEARAPRAHKKAKRTKQTGDSFWML